MRREQNGVLLAQVLDQLAHLPDLIWVETNRVTVEVPLSIPPTFYRVVWTPPDPVGVWDYRGYDSQGVLVVTGVLTLAWATNPPTDYCGWHDFKYAGNAALAGLRQVCAVLVQERRDEVVVDFGARHPFRFGWEGAVLEGSRP